MKTILISISQAVAAKNILRTNVIQELLADPRIRVVCVVKNKERARYYEREVGRDRLTFEVGHFAPHGVWERLFSALKFQLIRTATTDLRRRMQREESDNWSDYVVGSVFNRIVARPFFRRMARFFDYYLVSDPECVAALEVIKPDIVFLPHLFDDVEISLLRESRRRGIRTMGFINSWDKLTARSAIRLLPDSLVVFNDIIKREVMGHADMPAQKIIVTGVPQYDRYVTETPASRDIFYKRNNLDSQRAIVLFAPMGSTFSNSDWDMIDLLYEIIQDDRQVPNAELFVRFQPNDFFDEAEITKRPWLKYVYPGVRYGSERGGDWDMNFEELQNLTDTLAHISVLVCYASSMSVDAAAFDRPVINIDFEIKPVRRLSEAPTQFYQMEHYQNAVKTGGIRMVRSKQELIAWIRKYLENPKRDATGRARLISEQAGRMDGRAGERIANAIMQARETSRVKKE